MFINLADSYGDQQPNLIHSTARQNDYMLIELVNQFLNVVEMRQHIQNKPNVEQLRNKFRTAHHMLINVLKFTKH